MLLTQHLKIHRYRQEQSTVNYPVLVPLKLSCRPSLTWPLLSLQNLIAVDSPFNGEDEAGTRIPHQANLQYL